MFCLSGSYSAFLEFGALRICDISYSNFRDPDIHLLPTSSPFLYLPGAGLTFFDLLISLICFVCSSTFHCQLIMMVLTSAPG
jgi:hypothetical protein